MEEKITEITLQEKMQSVIKEAQEAEKARIAKICSNIEKLLIENGLEMTVDHVIKVIPKKK